jgi:hypothetical protein
MRCGWPSWRAGRKQATGWLTVLQRAVGCAGMAVCADSQAEKSELHPARAGCRKFVIGGPPATCRQTLLDFLGLINGVALCVR